ncbi:tyrosinase [Aspergillus minisclerotigenes]|uniref:tyrosinase n=1 Tax=Aspergillus minisclerotigenes TaxID=656917 RepID=A0A5N6ISA7_9EURO|nr:tyrosinase [Aspergillus minisclerotigenes]
MSLTYFPITGIPVDPGSPTPVRREIASWSISSDPVDRIQVSLFIRALRIFQEKDLKSDQLSYYQIAAIHGFPLLPWDNVPAKFYCPHNSFIFPTWHRPYMLLYEQCLYNIMDKEIVPSIQNTDRREEWKAAAKQWRLPYWDWALPQADTGKLGVPKLVDESRVQILKLDSQDLESVLNPLHKYTNRFGGRGVAMGDQRTLGGFAINYEEEPEYNKCIGTSRYGDPSDESSWANGVQNNTEITKAFTTHDWHGQRSIAHNVYRILTEDYFKSYEPFSYTMYRNRPDLRATDFFSLEMIHNYIHGWTGGSHGHMSEVPVAAFDPIFWLHHCNVDRILAIWQYLNPDKWFDDRVAGDPKPTDPLLPFHKDSQELKAELYELYGRTLTKLKDPEERVPGIGDDNFQDYIINIQYDRLALEGRPYTINFDLKESDRPGKIGRTRRLGSVYNFSSPLIPVCENCESQKKGDVKSKAQVPITLHLHSLAKDTEFPDLISLESDDVEVLLEQQLCWSVTTLSGEVIPLQDFLGLRVTVHGAPARFPAPDSLDVFQPDNYKELSGATRNKLGGTASSSAQ